MKNILLILTFIFSAFSGFAQVKPNVDDKGVAIQGYDPVSYFTGKPLPGKPELSATHSGAKYFFSSEANKKAFLENPAKYEPAYGGYCAYAIGKHNELVEINPQTFKIVDGKLLLFYNKWLNNTLTSWDKDEKTLYKAAEENWKKRDKSAGQ